jgi:hypothetical protein
MSRAVPVALDPVRGMRVSILAVVIVCVPLGRAG